VMRTTRASTMTSLPQSHSTTLNGLLFFPPNPPNPKQNLIPKHQVFQHRITVSRRDIALLPFLALVPSLSPVAPASAFSIGICTHRAFALTNFGFLMLFFFLMKL
jgi:hypothetical protein